MWLIEQRGQDGRWFIRGSERMRHDAEHWARKYRSQNNMDVIRVVRVDRSEQCERSEDL